MYLASYSAHNFSHIGHKHNHKDIYTSDVSIRKATCASALGFSIISGKWDKLSCVLEMAENKEEANSFILTMTTMEKPSCFSLFFLFLAVLDLKVGEQ